MAFDSPAQIHYFLFKKRRSLMQTVRAYFDGKQIQLEEPLELQPQEKLLVTLLRDDAASPSDIEHAAILDTTNGDFLGEDEIAYYKTLK